MFLKIKTKITEQGSALALGEYVGSREKLTRRQFWNTLYEDIVFLIFESSLTTKWWT